MVGDGRGGDERIDEGCEGTMMFGRGVVIVGTGMARSVRRLLADRVVTMFT